MNVLTENLPMLLEGTGETLAMVFVSALFAYVIGLPLGVALIVTDKNGASARCWAGSSTSAGPSPL